MAKPNPDVRLRQNRYATSYYQEKYIVMYCLSGSTFIFVKEFKDQEDRANWVRDHLNGFVAVGSLGD